jgi:hypothetical protein
MQFCQAICLLLFCTSAINAFTPSFPFPANVLKSLVVEYGLDNKLQVLGLHTNGVAGLLASATSEEGDHFEWTKFSLYPPYSPMPWTLNYSFSELSAIKGFNNTIQLLGLNNVSSAVELIATYDGVWKQPGSILPSFGTNVRSFALSKYFNMAVIIALDSQYKVNYLGYQSSTGIWTPLNINSAASAPTFDRLWVEHGLNNITQVVALKNNKVFSAGWLTSETTINTESIQLSSEEVLFQDITLVRGLNDSLIVFGLSTQGKLYFVASQNTETDNWESHNVLLYAPATPFTSVKAIERNGIVQVLCLDQQGAIIVAAHHNLSAGAWTNSTTSHVVLNDEGDFFELIPSNLYFFEKNISSFTLLPCPSHFYEFLVVGIESSEVGYPAPYIVSGQIRDSLTYDLINEPLGIRRQNKMLNGVHYAFQRISRFGDRFSVDFLGQFDDTNVSLTTIQGMGRFDDHYIFVHGHSTPQTNTKGYFTVAVAARRGVHNGIVSYEKDIKVAAGFDRPNGIQVIGDFVSVGIADANSVKPGYGTLYFVGNIENENEFRASNIKVQSPSISFAPNCVGITHTYEPGLRYIMVMYQATNATSGLLHFFSTPYDLDDPRGNNWKYEFATDNIEGAPENINLLTDSIDGSIYILNMWGPEKGDSTVSLILLDWANKSVSFVHKRIKLYYDSKVSGGFRYGAGTHVENEFDLELYGSAKESNNLIADLNYVVFTY